MFRNRALYVKEFYVDNKTSTFLLLHHFKIENSFFKDNEEAKFGNKENKYSILGYLNDDFKIGGKFFFFLEYPNENCTFYFTQEKNPIESKPNDEINYQDIKTTCSMSITVPFSGLIKSEESATFLSIPPYSDVTWHYSIGQKQSWYSDMCLTAFLSAHTPCITDVNFYVVIKDISLLKQIHSL